jgi:hypothetical protein
MKESFSFFKDKEIFILITMQCPITLVFPCEHPHDFSKEKWQVVVNVLVFVHILIQMNQYESY